MAERAGVCAEAEIALYQYGLRKDGDRNDGERGEDCDGRDRGVEPTDAGGGENDFESVAQKLSAQFGQAANLMNAVAALGHVGFEAALEIAVAEAGDLVEKCQAQADFEMASEAEEARN